MRFLSEKLEIISFPSNLDEQFPTVLAIFNRRKLDLPDEGTHFGYIFEGTCIIEAFGNRYPLNEGMYFSVPDAFTISGEATGFIITRKDVYGLFYIGGKVESKGRLKYIDGCSDTLLIPPILIGYPCLNFLHIPPNVNQTAHTHPSVRIGLVISGEGVCKALGDIFPLLPGNIFILPTNGIHSFHTEMSELRIIVYHPDSDFGPSDSQHPMLNKTLVNGVRAADIESIRTKKIL